ncbi:MFS general substrate transporter [Exidia glandulosa HHB12029]|uniref:MFS general substrate transporter n=1 Tax=Exidia glandulosa HHB12029 TaxID=1314781 RepID=A0A165K8S4_EXIGL|nr:MFS general substrate transporter [Exidia glandulosa HHB12029]
MDGMEHVKESVSLEGSRDGTQSEDSITYPEGGLTAWSVAFSAWCSMMAAFGIINSMGVFQAYVSTTLLPSYSPDAIGWIFGIYVFVSYFCGVQIGPIFDAKGPTLLLVAGSVCMVGSTFALAHCTKYWHFIITLSLVNGIGSSLLFTPAMGAVAHWFHQRRGTATGFAFIGGGLGGVIFPLLVQPLLPHVGWAWTMRIVAFVQLVLCIVIVTLCRGRLPPKSSISLTPTRDMLPDLRMFLDPAMAVTSAGVFFVEWAYFVPISYIPSYYLVRQGLATAGSATSSDAAFAYQLLAILNGVSCIGRFSAGYIADRAGRFNTMIISNLLCLLAVATFWMADTLIAKPPGSTLLVAFVAVFGFASGANITLIPICVGQLCDTRDYGRYYASAYSITSFGCLTGIPIAGRLLAVTGESGRRAFWGLVLFAAMSYVAAFLCFLWVRVYVKGWNLRVRW